jgi:hypothetical protein
MSQSFTVGLLFVAVAQFCYIFVGSFVCAVIIGLWSAWVREREREWEWESERESEWTRKKENLCECDNLITVLFVQISVTIL